MVSAKQVRTAIYNRLNVASVTTSLASGSASLHHSVAPSSAGYPMVVYNRQASTETLAFSGTAIESDVWMVKAVTKGGSSSAAEDIDKAVSDRLHFKDLAISGADHMYLARESAVDYSEVVSGDVYRHHGHLYRLVYQDT